MILEIGGLAFFNSRVAAAPTVAAPEFALVLVLLNILILVLLLGGAPGSSDCCRGWTGWPDTVLFLSIPDTAEADALNMAGLDSVRSSSWPLSRPLWFLLEPKR
jgi:hypothetical protein